MPGVAAMWPVSLPAVSRIERRASAAPRRPSAGARSAGRLRRAAATSRRWRKWPRIIHAKSDSRPQSALRQVSRLPFQSSTSSRIRSRRPPATPPQLQAERQVEPDDRVGRADQRVAELGLVVAVDHPAVRRGVHRLAHARAKLLGTRLGPVRPVVERVELDVRHAQPLGELAAEGRLARARRALDVDAPHAVAAAYRQKSRISGVRVGPGICTCVSRIAADHLWSQRYGSVTRERAFGSYPGGDEPARRLQPGRARLVRAGVRGADPGAGARLAVDRARRAHADPGPDRLGQDAGGLPLRDRPAQREPGRGPAASIRLAAEGTELRHRAQPARPAGRPALGAARRCPHRRHAAEGARCDGAQPAGHPDHHPGVALPAADLAGARDAARDRDRDRRRGARRGRDEARRSSGAQPRAARPADRQADPARRPLGDAAAARGDRPLRLGRARDRARRRGEGEGARPEGGRAARRHARAGGAAVDLAVDLPRDPRARPRAPLDDRLRQQPPPRRAAGAARSNDLGEPAPLRATSQATRKRSRAPTTARWHASSASRSRSC